MNQTKNVSYDELTVKEKIHDGIFSSIYTVRLEGGIYAIKVPRFDDEETVRKGICPNQTVGTDDDNFHRKTRIWHDIWGSAPDDVVCPVAFDNKPFPWVVMELADSSFSTEIREGNADVGDIVKILDSLKDLRGEDIVHGNVEPDNLLLIDGNWKIGDFGISFESDPVRAVNVNVTVSPYSAPEMIDTDRFGQVDERTDVWQVGAMLYRLLTGKMPFKTSKNAIISSITNDEPDMSKVPGVYRNIVARALAKNKDDRYPSVVEFAEDLRAVYRPQ